MSIKTVNEKVKWNNICPFLFSIALFYISLILFLSQTFSEKGFFRSDTLAHIGIAESISNGNNTEAVHILLHILVILFSKITSIAISVSMPIILSLFVITQFLILHKYFEIELSNKKYNKYPIYTILALIILFSAPIHIPQIHEYKMYVGKISNNIWHNPTIIGLKPIALLVFFTFLKFLKEPSTVKYQILFNILLLISVWIKPNFAIYFIPSSFIMLITSLNLELRSKIILVIKLYSLTTISLLIQLYYLNEIDNGDNKIIISPGEVWSVYATNIPLNILCSFLFPISVIIINKQSLKRKDLQLSLLGAIISMLQFYCLAESGTRFYDGNWSWGLQTSSIFLWMITLVVYVEKIKSHKLLTNLLLSVILMSHVYFGIIYFLRIFSGITYF